MKTLLIVSLWVMQLGFSQPSVCSSSPPPLDLVAPPAKINTAFSFKIHPHANPASYHRNSKGTFFTGNLSTLELLGPGSTHRYTSSNFSFKYPPQHRIAQVSQQVMEMQIMYQLDSDNLTKWKHRSLVMSVSFVVTEYAPGQGFTVGTQINQKFKNGSIIDFGKLLPLVSGINMALYKGIHSDFPQDKTTLWMVRRELLLMSQSQFKLIKQHFMAQSTQQTPEYHGLLERVSDVNEISQQLSPQQPTTIQL